MRKGNIYIAIICGVMFPFASIAQDYVSVDNCEALNDLDRSTLENRVDPMFFNDCRMRGGSPPAALVPRDGVFESYSVPTIQTGTTPPQKPPARARTNAGAGGLGGLLGGILQGLPIKFPPSIPDLFGGGGSTGGGPGTPGGGAGGGAGAGGPSGGTIAEDSVRCEVYGETESIPQITGQYAMPCGGAIELTDAAFTMDTNVEFIGHVERNKSVLKLYKRQQVTETVDGKTEAVGAKFVFNKEIEFPGYYCKGTSVYSENVPLPPREQFFSIGDNTRFLAIQIQPDTNPNVTTDPLNPGNATGSLNYDFATEFIIIERNGNNFTPVGKNCDFKENVLFGMPANMGAIMALPSSEDYCSVQSFPMIGACEPEVMWLNLDDSNYLFQPNAALQLHKIEGAGTVAVESDAYTAFYMRESSSLYIPWGSGLQTFADGVDIIYSPDFYIYVPPPGKFEIKGGGKVYLPGGGTLYSSDDVKQTDYAPSTEVAKGSDFAYEARPRGAIALPAGVFAVGKASGTIRVPEDK